MIFKDQFCYPLFVAHKISTAFKEGWQGKSSIPIGIMRYLSYDVNRQWGYFDKACQVRPSNCGVGVVLFLNHAHFFMLKFGVGLYSNNPIEVIVS